MTRYEQEYDKILKQCVKVRKEQKITQHELADMILSCQAEITKIERMRTIPGVLKFMEYLDAIGLKLEVVER